MSVSTIRDRVPDTASPGVRLDTYLAETLRLCSRSQLRRRLLKALVNGSEAKLSRRLRAGDQLEVQLAPPPALEVAPQPIPLDILFEDENLMVINKPQGLVVHPGCGNPSGTLVNALLHHCKTLKEKFPGQPIRPGIVHRLDKDTSGLIVVAKNPAAQEFLASQFRGRRVRKQYLAVVQGTPPQEKGRIETRICRDPGNRKRFTCSATRGRLAVTRYRLIRSLKGSSLLTLYPKTGRTHQLRVHMRRLGCPILGDPLYGRAAPHPLLLHAYRLWIILPGEEEPRVFRAPLPPLFREYLRALRSCPPGRD